MARQLRKGVGSDSAAACKVLADRLQDLLLAFLKRRHANDRTLETMTQFGNQRLRARTRRDQAKIDRPLLGRTDRAKPSLHYPKKDKLIILRNEIDPLQNRRPFVGRCDLSRRRRRGTRPRPFRVSLKIARRKDELFARDDDADPLRASAGPMNLTSQRHQSTSALSHNQERQIRCRQLWSDLGNLPHVRGRALE